MSKEIIREAFSNLCIKDPRHPLYEDTYGSDDEKPEPRTGCYCDNCFYGRDKLAVEILRLTAWRRFDSLIEATDDWHPCFPGNMVRISLQTNGIVNLVCVWGADDFGMELFLDDFAEAVEIHTKIIKENLISQEYLQEIGLKVA